VFPVRNGGVADPYYLLMARAAIGLVLLVLVAGCQKLPAPASALSSPPAPPPGQVVPWTPLAPNWAPPAPSLGPAPLPPGTPPCQANDLAASVTGSNGATGHVITSFGFAGTGTVCYLEGSPSVGILDSKGSPIGFRQRAPYFPPTHPGRALIQPGAVPAPYTETKVGQASLNIDWISQPEACPVVDPTQRAQPATAVIAIPAGGIIEVPIPLEPAAYACAGLGVGVFETPYVPMQPGPPPPLPALSMQVPASGHIGQALPYLVTLTNEGSQRTDFTSLCPNYEEELFADIVHGSPPLGGKHLYALNCGEAGPIQPGASVTFQMVFLVPVSAAPGKYTLTFGLGFLNAMTSFAQAVVTLH
jgi:hypothetical protein